MKRSFSAILFLKIACLGLIPLLSGCVSYHLGNSTKPPFRTVYVAPVNNRSEANQVQNILWEQVCQALMESPSVELVSSPERADAILEVTIRSFRQSISSTSEQDSVRAKSYWLSMTADCSLKNPEKNNYWIRNQSVSASVNAYIESNFIESKYQSMPKLTSELARKIRNIMIDSW